MICLKTVNINSAACRDFVVIGAVTYLSGLTVDFGLVRYNNDGSLDNSFGNSGLVHTDFGGYEAAGGITLQPDGKIVVTLAVEHPKMRGEKRQKGKHE